MKNNLESGINELVKESKDFDYYGDWKANAKPLPMKKEDVVKAIKNLPFGDVLYGYDKNDFKSPININEYYPDEDMFGGYGEDMKYRKMKFEELPNLVNLKKYLEKGK